MAGSCAAGASEPRQVREEAAVRSSLLGAAGVPDRSSRVPVSRETRLEGGCTAFCSFLNIPAAILGRRIRWEY